MAAHTPVRPRRTPRNRRLALLAWVPAHQLALCDDMTFHPGIHLAPLCATAQIQFAIKSEDLERIPMRAGGRTRTFVIGLAKISCAANEAIAASNVRAAPLVISFRIVRPSIEIALNRQT
jgi:hypothetical protein